MPIYTYIPITVIYCCYNVRVVNLSLVISLFCMMTTYYDVKEYFKRETAQNDNSFHTQK